MWCGCGCCDPREVFRGGAYGPSPWSRQWGRWWGRPTKAERKEWLEVHKKQLQEELSDVEEELGKL
jgi:hypothetical protein